jgi:hypothetical protein
MCKFTGSRKMSDRHFEVSPALANEKKVVDVS